MGMPFFFQLFWLGKKTHINTKDAKSIPSPGKFKRVMFKKSLKVEG